MELTVIIAVCGAAVAVVGVALLVIFNHPRCTWCRYRWTVREDVYGGSELWSCPKCQHKWFDSLPKFGP